MQISVDECDDVTVSGTEDHIIKNSLRRAVITLPKLTPTSIECLQLPSHINGEFVARRIGQLPLHEKDPVLIMNNFNKCDCTKKLQPMCEQCTMFLFIHEQCDGPPLKIGDQIQVINEKTILTSTGTFFDVKFFKYYRLYSDDCDDDFFKITKIEEKEDRYKMIASGLQWHEIKPSKSTQLLDENKLLNENIVKNLNLSNPTFSQKEWDAFGIKNLTLENFIEKNGKYFKPTEMKDKLSLIPGYKIVIASRNGIDISFRMPKNKKIITSSHIHRWTDNSTSQCEPFHPSVIAQKQEKMLSKNDQQTRMIGIPCEQEIPLCVLQEGDTLHIRITVNKIKHFPICSSYITCDEEEELKITKSSKGISNKSLINDAIMELKKECNACKWENIIHE